MNIPTKKQYLILYRDSNARMMEGMNWSAYTFDTPEERDAMVADINSAHSAWHDEAVTIVVSEIMVPLVAVLPEIVDSNFSAFDGSV